MFLILFFFGFLPCRLIPLPCSESYFLWIEHWHTCHKTGRKLPCGNHCLLAYPLSASFLPGNLRFLAVENQTRKQPPGTIWPIAGVSLLLLTLFFSFFNFPFFFAFCVKTNSIAPVPSVRQQGLQCDPFLW